MKYGTRPARRGEPNYAMVDGYTLWHITAGAFVGLAGIGPWTALAATVAWELVEDRLKASLPDWFPVETYDSLANQVGDTASFMGGWYAGSRFCRWPRLTP
jgi:hypothetical protein